MDSTSAPTSITQESIELIQKQAELAQASSVLLAPQNIQWGASMMAQMYQHMGVETPPELIKLVRARVRTKHPTDVVKGLIQLQADMFYADKPHERLKQMQLLIVQYMQDLQLDIILPKKYEYWRDYQISAFQDSRPLIAWFNQLFLKGTSDFQIPFFKLHWAIQDSIVSNVFTFSDWQYKGCKVKWTPKRIIWRLRVEMPPVQRELPHLDMEYLRGLYV